MALESGFFNDVNGDRLYNADDMSRYFENIMSSGIFKRITDCLKVSAASGMTLTVAPGAGLINCRWFRTETPESVTIPTANAVLPRFDIVVARLDMSDAVRSISLQVVSGTPAATPAAPEPVRTADMHDLVLALVYVPAGASEIVDANLTDVRANEWYCGYVHSLVDTPTMQALHSRYTAPVNNTVNIPINVVGFNANVDILNVYVEGFRMAPGVEFTIDEERSMVTLVEPVDKGTLIDVEVYKPTMPDDVPDLADNVAALMEDVTGYNDALVEADNEIAELQSRVDTLEAELAKVAPITAGDFAFGEAFIVTGFASSESTRVYFSIPFNRPILATTATIKTMGVAARQSESYVLGSASSFYNIAGDIVSTRLSNNGMLTIVAEPTFTVAPFNNAEVSFYINTGAVVTFA